MLFGKKALKQMGQELSVEWFESALQEVLIQHRSFGQGHPITAVGVVAEQALLVKGKPTIFVETSALAESAYLCGYRIELDAINVPGDITAICFPEGTVVGGFPLTHMFIGFLPELLEKVYRPLGDKTEELNGVKPLVIGFPTPEGYSVLKLATQEDLDKYFSGAMDHRYSFDNPLHPLSNMELEQKKLMIQARVAIGLMAYVQAFPNMLVPGFPETMKERDVRISLVPGIGKNHRIRVGKTLKLHPDFLEHKDPHWRVGHLRYLRSERFTRNPDGSIRFTHVKGCFVQGKAIVPSTALESK